MKRCVTGLCVLLLVGMCVMGANAEKPDKAEKAKPAKAARVYAPYHKLDLTDDQRAKIAAIQQEIRAEIKKLQQQEAERVAAVLTDEQKAQIAKDDEAAAKKQAEAAKKYREKLKEKQDKEKKAE